ncbi:MAG: response regulator [Proteobacteria bacterium]|nr:response regulator [Pseudomonadota bacterium]
MSVCRHTVYVVDDDDAVRESLVFLLGVEGLHVQGFPRAECLLKALPPRPRGCIVADMHMPGAGGLDLLRVLNEHGVRLPVILISGQGSMATRLAAFASGAFEVIAKPFQDNAIVRTVRAALAKAAADPCGIGPPQVMFADQPSGSL